MSINVLIIDDHEVVRSGLAVLFRGMAIDIVAEASAPGGAIAKILKHRPDVVLLEVLLGTDLDSFACLRRIRQKSPHTSIVIFSAHENPTYVARSVALGASDYILKSCSRQDLIGAIKGAARGKGPSKAGAMHRISDIMSSHEVPADVPLTKRETQVVRHIGYGLSNKEIACSLHISVETVKEHVQNILRKLDFADRTQAGVWAVRKELV